MKKDLEEKKKDLIKKKFERTKTIKCVTFKKENSNLESSYISSKSIK